MKEQALDIANQAFEEAVERLVAAKAVKARTAELVSKVYSQRRVFALAKSASVKTTKRFQALLVEVIQEGLPGSVFTETMARFQNWGHAYAETVYRTNLSTAYTAGRFQGGAEPDMREYMPAFRFSAVLDSSVRRGRPGVDGPPGDAENHAALDGFIAQTNDPVWSEWSPPLGYNCRCSLRLVSVFELERKGLLVDGVFHAPTFPAKARKHPGFGTRPDHAYYFGVK